MSIPYIIRPLPKNIENMFVNDILSAGYYDIHKFRKCSCSTGHQSEYNKNVNWDSYTILQNVNSNKALLIHFNRSV